MHNTPRLRMSPVAEEASERIDLDEPSEAIDELDPYTNHIPEFAGDTTTVENFNRLAKLVQMLGGRQKKRRRAINTDNDSDDSDAIPVRVGKQSRRGVTRRANKEHTVNIYSDHQIERYLPIKQELVREVIYSMTGHDSERAFVYHNAADTDAVAAIGRGLSNEGPKPLRIHFDMNNVESAWNAMAFELIYERAVEEDEELTCSKEKRYYLKLIKEKFKRCKGYWKESRTRNIDGHVETIEETTQRVQETNQRKDRDLRRYTRRQEVRLHEIKIILLLMLANSFSRTASSYARNQST